MGVVSWTQILALLALGRHVGKMDALLVELRERLNKCVLHVAIRKICVVVHGGYFLMYAVVDVADGKSQVVVAVADCSQNPL
jgi:hypothetical protein